MPRLHRDPRHRLNRKALREAALPPERQVDPPSSDRAASAKEPPPSAEADGVDDTVRRMVEAAYT